MQASDLLGSLTSYGSGALNVVILLVLAVFVGALVAGGFYLYNRSKRYKEYTAIIWYRDGFGQLQQLHDRAGVFLDKKTNNKRLFLERANVGLSPDNIPYLMTSKGARFVYLFRTGLKNFRFIKPVISNDHVTIQVGEEDVNWGVNSYERGKATFVNSGLMQYLPFITLAFVSVVILIIFIYFFKNFDVLKEVAVSLDSAAQAISAASRNTTVILS